MGAVTRADPATRRGRSARVSAEGALPRSRAVARPRRPSLGRCSLASLPTPLSRPPPSSDLWRDLAAANRRFPDGVAELNCTGCALWKDPRRKHGAPKSPDHPAAFPLRLIGPAEQSRSPATRRRTSPELWTRRSPRLPLASGPDLATPSPPPHPSSPFTPPFPFRPTTGPRPNHRVDVECRPACEPSQRERALAPCRRNSLATWCRTWPCPREACTKS